jgi:glutathione S-transferase
VDEQPEAKRRATHMLAERIPKYLRYFEKVLGSDAASAGSTRFMLGTTFSYVDISMFQVVAGLQYAFPRALVALATAIPGLMGLAGRVGERPRLAAYVASTRRVPFNQQGVFRHYPELDNLGAH